MPVTPTVPEEDALNVAVHDAVPTGLVPWASVHGVVVPKSPAGLNATVPAGVETVPALVAGSTTVAVQVAACATITVEGEHETVVVVGRRLTVSLAWLLPGPALFVAVTMTVNVPDLV